MDRYGYVSNNYSGHAMAGQTRAIAGAGGCGCSSHHHHKTTHMQATQPATCQCHMKGGRPPVIMSQPMMQGSGPMIFSQEGRDWTTGICGCFEHCASCMFSSLSSFITYSRYWLLSVSLLGPYGLRGCKNRPAPIRS